MLSTKSKFTTRQMVLAVLLLVLVVSVSATGLIRGPQSGTQGQQQGPRVSGPILGQTAQTPSAAQEAENARQAESTLVGTLPGGGEVHRTVKKAISPPARTLPERRIVEPPTKPLSREHYLPGGGSPPLDRDTALQTVYGPQVMPNPIANFDGIHNYWGGIPPDTVGDVGPKHYVQMVNVGFQIYDKATGNPLTGVIDFNELYKAVSFGGQCEAQNAGDPVVVYDQLADRWLLTQFTAPINLPVEGAPVGSGPYFECIAISMTSDPTGAYHLYAFQTSEVNFEDYPHFGVWPDAYYMATNEAEAGLLILSAGFYAFERDKMLAGDPGARMIYFNRPFPDGGYLPSDLDGYRLPPAGSPNFFMAPNRIQGDSVRQYKFDITTWDPAPVAALVGPFDIPVEPFDSLAPQVPQPEGPALDSISDRFMNRLAYRNMGTHQSLVVNHTVSVPEGDSERASIRWYEFRDPDNPILPTVHQQGTYAPPDGLHRWMASAAMDGAGNIAIGYSVSGANLFPSIRYAGRLVSDPLNALSQGEQTLFTGGGSQTEALPDAQRWGDYSSLNVDVDDCTFWYTTEYYAQTGLRNWRTRIGSFKMPNCVAASTATPVPTGTPATPTRTATPSATSCPGVLTVQGSITTTDKLVVGRLSRDGVPSTCGTTKPCPALADQVQRHYRTHRFFNNSLNPQCITVRIVNNCGDNALLSAAYVDEFDANNQCTNYLGDMGSAGPEFSYSFTVPAQRSYEVAVLENSANVGCANYTVSVNQCQVGTAVPSVTGTPPTATPSRTRTATATPSATPCATDTLFSENFDLGTLGAFTSTHPASPAGDSPWMVSSVAAHTGIWSAHVRNNDEESDQRLEMINAFTVTTTTNDVSMQFYHRFVFETIEAPASFDGGVLEYSTNNGTSWTDGGSLITEGGYNAVLAGPGNPLTGREAWGTTSPGHPAFTRVTVNLNTLKGQSVKFRFRHGSDESGDAEGWYVDSVRILEQLPCGGALPTATATVTATACPVQFQDVPPSTDVSSFYPYVRCLACRGIISGYPCGGTNPETNQPEPCGTSGNPYYRPSNQITRGQISKIVAGASGSTGDPGPQKYEDVPPNSPFYQWINRLSNENVMGGYPCGGPGEPCGNGNRPYFRPGANATRGQMSKIVSNAAGFDDPATGQSFEDLPPSDEPSSYYQYVERLHARGIVGGYPCGGDDEECGDEDRPYFRPNANVTRGQAAKIAANTFYPHCQTPARR